MGTLQETQRHILRVFLNLSLFAITLYLWMWVKGQVFPTRLSVAIIVGAILLVVPISWIGWKLLDAKPTVDRAVLTTSMVHFFLMMALGSAIVEAIKTNQSWKGWEIPIPVEISLPILWVSIVVTFITVLNLAIAGLGAPFAIALSRRLAVGGLYEWTRNPMILSTLITLFIAGLYLQSLLFILWVVLVVAPAWLVIVKVFEERELEIRFGPSYLEYKARTPLLVPRKPGHKKLKAI